MAAIAIQTPHLRLSYDKLWALLKQRGMHKKDLQAAATISSGTMAKLSKSDNIQTNILLRICQALNCDIGDICEVQRTNQNEDVDS